MPKQIALIGEYNPDFPPHVATDRAIADANASRNTDIQGIWVSTAAIDATLFQTFDAIWVAPGSPYKNLDNTLWAIRYAREHKIPCFGTCGGFQHMILEYARNVLGFEAAQHAEYDPYASDLFIAQLDCSLVGRELELEFIPGSQIAAIYGQTTAIEQYYCNFGVNPDYVTPLQSGELNVTGSDAEGEIRVIELPNHPFFIGTLFVPQARSTPENPHPIVTAFLASLM
ncbi:CTP synthase [filamentous cyanobacterium LEGE 11480]|uniref:CTP synthase (glutamine hydrolyzing) n=1 Tax=Romeriopsis navalis LEGE 11480 TaxID=2777977 RepID=A0A928VRZ1_9CYAN|nr:hypothetical protein [Romeriopsis navalis]MBE9032678.1 CTP synthase [Romeriopsis navalis LEGE 11480]